MEKVKIKERIEKNLEGFIFASRWFQAPMYFGLIVGGGLYAWQFMLELFEMFHSAGIVSSTLMMAMLNLVDIIMIGQLLTMVIIGGWHTFVSKIDLSQEDNKLEWLDTVNAGILKVKMATSLIGVSGIHLLQTFISLQKHVDDGIVINDRLIIYQVAIHITFLFSAIMLAWVEKMTDHKKH